jgi:hypothetical protein
MPGDTIPGNTMGSAAARRDEGIRRITRMTWRAGAAGVACAAIIAVAFGHHAQASQARPDSPGTIVVPNQPPAPGHGNAPHAVSGAS